MWKIIYLPVEFLMLDVYLNFIFKFTGLDVEFQYTVRIFLFSWSVMIAEDILTSGLYQRTGRQVSSEMIYSTTNIASTNSQQRICDYACSIFSLLLHDAR